MYITEINNDCVKDTFNWTTYFGDQSGEEILKQVDHEKIFYAMRDLIKEDKSSLNLALVKLVKNLLKGIDIKEPNILELGAATGFLTRVLISRYGGRGTLVDNCEESYKHFLDTKSGMEDRIDYVIRDLFEFETDRTYDITCSFGLIEHFVDKTAVIEAHKKYLKKGGYLIILIPMESNLSKAFFTLHPELNLGYRELLNRTEFRKVLMDNGLEIVSMEKSNDYSYDFIGALCRIKDTED